MGYDELNSKRFGPFAIAAILLGLALGVAMPVGPVAASPSDTDVSATAKQALPSAAAKTDGTIVVADKNKNKNKNWNNSKNWNNKNWNNKKVVVVRPYRKWNNKGYYGRVIGALPLARFWARPPIRPWRLHQAFAGTGPIRR